MRQIIFLLCIFFLASCSKDDKDKDNKTYVTPPRFSVDPIENSGIVIDASALSVSSVRSPWYSTMFKKIGIWSTSFVIPTIQAQNAISCSEELDNWNAAPQLYGQSRTRSPQEYVESFYAQAVFYDCNARQQAQEDGVGSSTETDGDTEETVTILTAKTVKASAPDDFTRFVSWTDLPENENVRGKLVNKYLLEKDGARTKTRIDLEIENGARDVKSFLLAREADGDLSYTRADFTEILDDEGRPIAHQVSGRYYDDQDQVIVEIAAYSTTDNGTAVFMKKCTSVSNYSDSCLIAATPHYYDSDGDDMNALEVQESGLPTDISDDKIEEVTEFFTGTEENYFKPEFTIGN